MELTVFASSVTAVFVVFGLTLRATFRTPSPGERLDSTIGILTTDNE